MLSTLPIIDQQPAFHFEGPADWFRFAGGGREYVYITDGSQIYEIDAEAFDSAIARGDSLATIGIPLPGAIPTKPPTFAPIRAISLAIAQKCNLACAYCYADGGSFGGAPTAMSVDVARAAVDRLFDAARPGDRVNVSFLGGEPLMARRTLRETTEYAAAMGSRRGVSVGFAITTNATLLNRDDAEFFQAHRFAVTVSIDGTPEVQNQQRPFKSGGGTFARVIANIGPLLARDVPVFARATVTDFKIDLPTALNQLLALGFTSVGFAPLLSAPNGRRELTSTHLKEVLLQMIACGREFERRVAGGDDYGFANMMDAMNEIHRGSHRAYPCGAGNGYVGVSASGELAPCHRFVGDSQVALGSILNGIDHHRQRRWLADRQVDNQEPCRSCWARYLCGGGCHHEVLSRGRFACDYIRGWLQYALEAYVRLRALRPNYFREAAIDTRH
jgi:uncharacterized protein